MSRAVPIAPSLAALSAGARAAGAVVSVGYLLGFVPGPLVAVVGGLALVTMGRALVLDASGGALSGASLALIAGALALGALRWGTMDLSAIRGAQSVLGPGVLVDPAAAAGGAWAAVGAAALALGVWARPLPTERGATAAWTHVEPLLCALAVTTVFWGPKLVVGSSSFYSDLGSWAAGAGVVAGAGTTIAWMLRHTRAWVSWATLALSGAGVIAGAAAIIAAP